MIIVHYYPNPLTGEGRITRSVVSLEPTCYGQLARLMGVQHDVSIVANGLTVDPADPVEARVVTLHRKVEDPVSALAFFFVDAGLFFGFELAAATFIVQAGAALALNFAVNAIFKPDQSDLGKIDDTPNAYSVSAASNSVRAYGGLPVPMGYLRMTPDVDARPWTQFVNDPENIREQTYIETVTKPYTAAKEEVDSDGSTYWADTGIAAFQPYPTNGPQYGLTLNWYLFSGSNIYRTRSFCFINQTAVSYVDLYYNTTTGLYTTNISTPTWVDFTTATTYSYETTITGQIPETTVQLNQFFNFGLGDLTVTDVRLGQVPITSYKGVVSRLAAFEQNRTVFSGAPTPEFPPYTALDSAWRQNVISVDGGELRQNANVTDTGFVTRSSYTNDVEFIQVDLSGQLWYSGNGGPELATCNFEIQYRPVAGVWVTPPGVPATITISNADNFPIRRTFGWATTTGQRYEVRVRKVTTDSDDARLTQDFEFTQVKFFRPDYDAAAAATEAVDRGAAQTRYGISVRAGGQINGTISDLNAIVSAKCWVWTGGGTPTAAPPSAGWSWQATENPAWWYLYWTMGIFRHRAAAAGHPLNGLGWMVGTDLADGTRLAGCGVEWARIDVESIATWATFCTTSNLTFSAVVTEQSSAFDILTKIARIGRGSPSWHTGKLGVIWEDPAAQPVASFGMPSILAGSFTVNYLGENVPEEIVLSYTDPDSDWQEREVRQTVPGFILPNNELQIRLWGCKSKAQATREARILAARQFFQRRRVSFQAAQEGLLIRRGDIILITHDLTNWAGSSRLADGSAGTFVRLVRRLEPMGATAVFVRIVNPDGTEQTGTATIVEGTHELTVTGVNIDFAAFPDAVPEDWVCYVGPEATPGKKFRVTSVEPADGRTVSITAADERPEMWSFEYAGGVGPIGPVPDAWPPDESDLGDSGERLVARIQGLAVTEKNCESGWHLVEWECVNARGGIVTIQPPGRAAGSYNVLGEQLLLQGPITNGTIFSVAPLLDIPAVGSISDTFTYQG